MRLQHVLAIGLTGLLAMPLLAQTSEIVPTPSQAQLDANSDQANSKQWMSFLGPETASVAAGKSDSVILHFHIADGFHINSHTPLSKFLIATQLVVIEGMGIKVAKVDFPAGQPYAFSFEPNNKLDVYSGDFAVTAHLVASKGAHPLHAALRYQACDHAACYPPKLLPVLVTLTAN